MTRSSSDYQIIAQINASGVSAWLSCAQKAEYDMDFPDKTLKAISVNTVVGNIVHYKLSGEDEYQPPEYICYSNELPTLRAAYAKAGVLTQAIRNELDWREIIDTEVRQEIFLADRETETRIKIVGIIDLVVDEGTAAPIIYEIKTGVHRPASAMTQLAVQTLLWDKLTEKKLEQVRLLWASGSRGRGVFVECQSRDYSEMVAAGKRIILHIQNMINRGSIATPSQITCSNCRLREDCAVAWK